ncbi:MAG: hypothetical protein J7M26_06090, partial [Armatimonadetes bacterium]|nr:hypothetical protein [Armatimonadota bacterium]
MLVTWRWHDDNGTPDNLSDDSYGWSDNGPMDELYVVPPLTRFAYVPGAVKLKYYPVDLASITLRTEDGVPVRGWLPGETPVSYDLDGDGSAELVLPHGWVWLAGEDDNGNGSLDAGEDRNGNGSLDGPAYLDENGDGSFTPGVDEYVMPGMDLEASYSGFSNEWGNVVIPNPALNLGWENHQAPVGFGAAASATSMAGTAIHVGTEGYSVGDTDGDGVADFGLAPGAKSPSETLLSLLWDPATSNVKGWLAAPAQLGNYRSAAKEIAAATGSPALAEGGLFLGSRIMEDVLNGRSVGFVSRLAPRKTLIVDASRIIECAGQQVERELTGTQSWEYGQANADKPVQLELNHPAKAMSLGGGNMLIVDSGNNRVVEVDSSGNVTWPLGEAYTDGPVVNWYSSSLNSDLHLRRPNDAQRFTSVYDIDGDGALDMVLHTLIADTGNDRVLHVRSWWAWDAAQGRWEQRHRVQRITPEYVVDPANAKRRVKAHFTHVAAIPHPDPTFSNPPTGNMIGYLCAAPNLKEIIVMGFYQTTPGGPVLFGPNPPADSYLPGATGPGSPRWDVWSWLYDDPTNATIERSNPLLFAGLRHMELTRLGDVLYLDIACAQYQGRQSDFD